MKNKIKVVFIGCTAMTHAIVVSMVNPVTTAALKASGCVFVITVTDRDEAKLMSLRDMCNVTTSVRNAVDGGDYIVLVSRESVERIADLDLSDKTVISMAAGLDFERLAAITGSARLVRISPNINARVGESYTAYSMRGITDGRIKDDVLNILGAFGAFGKTDETLMDAAIGISELGSAFVFTVVKAIEDGAVEQGFSRDEAKRIAVQTVLGSALNAETTADCDGFIKSVCAELAGARAGVEYLKMCGCSDIILGAIAKSVERVK